MHKQRISIAILSALGGIGCFLPWIKIMGMSFSGTDKNAGDGWIALFFYGIAFLLTLWGKKEETFSKRMFIWVTAMGLLGSAVGMIDIYNVINKVNSSVIGMGLYVVALCGVLIPFAGTITKK